MDTVDNKKIIEKFQTQNNTIRITPPSNNQLCENQLTSSFNQRSCLNFDENQTKTTTVRRSRQSMFIPDNISMEYSEKRLSLRSTVTFKDDYKHWKSNIGSYVRKKDKLKRKSTRLKRDSMMLNPNHCYQDQENGMSNQDFDDSDDFRREKVVKVRKKMSSENNVDNIAVFTNNEDDPLDISTPTNRKYKSSNNISRQVSNEN